MLAKVARLPLALIALCALVALCAVARFTGHHELAEFLTGHGALFGAAVIPIVGAGSTSSLNTVAANFLEYIDQKKVMSLIGDSNPTLAMIGRKTGVTGAYYDHSVIIGGSQGLVLGTNNIGNAIANATPLVQETFHVPLSKLYNVGFLDRESIEASEGSQGAFEDLVSSSLETAITNCGNELSRFVLGAGTATIGQIAAITVSPAGYPVGSAQVQLTSSEAYQYFEYQMTLDVTVSDGSAPLGAPDTVSVIGGDPAAQILILSAPINSVTDAPSGSWGSGSWVVGNYFIRDGNYATNSTSQAISTQQGITPFQPSPFTGIGSWCPSEAYRQSPGLASAAFLNVQRQKNGTRLAGLGLDLSNVPIETALITGITKAIQYSSNKRAPTRCAMGPESYQALLNTMQSNKFYTTMKGSGDAASISFSDVLLLRAGGAAVMVYMERFMPPQTAYLFSPEDFTLVSTKLCPAPMKFAGGEIFLSMQDSDVVQYRAGGYMNLVCTDPSNVVRLKLQS